MIKLKKLAYPLRFTPLHPQWFSYLYNKKIYSSITRYSTGIVLDIGCGNKSQKKYLSTGCTYLGLDLPFTSINWYKNSPDLYGSAEVLPLKDSAISTVLLLDVLEHIKSPGKCLEEAYRILSQNGILIIKIPFIYPIHDAPLDYTRWTEYGLLQLFDSYNFEIVESGKVGLPLETAALLVNIAISKHTLNWFNYKSMFFIIGIILSAIIPLINIGAWLLSKAGREDFLMPHTYHFVLKKKSGAGITRNTS